jgi:hypothetical protein
MLRARLIAEGVRAVYPAAIGGWQVPEEAMGPQLDTPPPTERHMGAADVVGAPPPPPPPPSGPAQWPDDKLDERKAKVPEWQKAGKTADEVIAFLANKGTLSDEQKARVRGWFAPAQQAQDVTPKVTYASLADRLHRCADRDTASLILDEGRALPADQQKELADIFASKFNTAEE